jgi:hypothetical protein
MLLAALIPVAEHAFLATCVLYPDQCGLNMKGKVCCAQGGSAEASPRGQNVLGAMVTQPPVLSLVSCTPLRSVKSIGCVRSERGLQGAAYTWYWRGLRTALSLPSEGKICETTVDVACKAPSSGLVNCSYAVVDV